MTDTASGPADPAAAERPATRGGPGWRAGIHRDWVRQGVRLVAGRQFSDGHVELLTRLDGLEGPHVLVADAAADHSTALFLPDDLARALYDALGQHYGSGSDARAVRADYEHARARHDLVVDALARLAEHALASPATRATADGPPPGYVRANPPRPADLADTRR